MGASAQERTDPTHERSAAAAPVVHFGRAVDVYGWRRGTGSRVIEPHAHDVVVGPNVLAPVAAGCSLLAANPDSGKKRILIEAEIGSAEFAATLQRLEGSVVELADVVPRDAALRVTWPAAGAAPRADAGDRVELVEAGSGAEAPFLMTERTDGLVLDPVVAGTAALRRGQAPVHGMPESRLRLRIRRGGVECTREFRVQGLLPDPEPPRLVAEMNVYLEQVGRLDDHTRVLTLFLGGIRQALDRGDVLRVLDPTTGKPVAAVEVLADAPLASIEGPQRVHVRVRAERGAAGEDVLERLDPSRLPGFPRAGGAARDAFVRAQAPKVTLVALFEPEDGDNAANFVRVDERELVDTAGNREGVSPQAGFQVRFSAPIDPSTLAGLRLLGDDADASHQVPARIVAVGDGDRVFRVQAPLGLCMTPNLREAIRADRAKPAAQRRPSFVLEVLGGPGGVKSRFGVLLPGSLRFGFVLDPEAANNFVAWRRFVAAK